MVYFYDFFLGFWHSILLIGFRIVCLLSGPNHKNFVDYVRFSVDRLCVCRITEIFPDMRIYIMKSLFGCYGCCVLLINTANLLPDACSFGFLRNFVLYYFVGGWLLDFILKY